MQSFDQQFGIPSPLSFCWASDGTPGSGSTGTKIRCYKNTRGEGGDIIHCKDTVLGDTFRIVTDGIYTVVVVDRASASSGNMYMGITKNIDYSDLSVKVTGIATDKRLCLGLPPDASLIGVATATVPLRGGDVLRSQHDGDNNGSTDSESYVMIIKH